MENTNSIVYFFFSFEGEVTTDMGVLAPSTDEEDENGISGGSSNFVFSPAVGVLIGVVVALVIMALIIVIVMRIQGAPPSRSICFSSCIQQCIY